MLREEDVEHYGKTYSMGSAHLLDVEGGRDYLPTAGLLMGDPGSVATFSHTLKRPVARWDTKLKTQDGTYETLWTRGAVTGTNADLGLTKYADDLKKAHLNLSNTLEEIRRGLHISERSLGEQIRHEGYQQSPTKQKILPHACGRGAWTLLHQIFEEAAGQNAQESKDRLRGAIPIASDRALGLAAPRDRLSVPRMPPPLRPGAGEAASG